MAVQMAPPANDLAQVCVSAKTAADFGDAGAAFKNILQGMRESRQKTPQTAPKGAKAPVNFAFLAGDADGDAANLEEPALIRPAEFEKTPDDGQEATPPSRFDPDVFLEALEAAAADKPDNCGEDAGRTEEDEPAPEDGAAEAETAPQPGDTPPACDDKAQAETLAAIAETNASALPVALVATEGKTEADEKNFSDEAAERPVQSAETQSGETAKLAAEDASRETKPRESQRAGAAKLSDANENINENENTENIGRETSSAREDGEHAAAEKSGTRVPKAVSRASEAVHKSSGQENAGEGKSPSGNSLSEKSSPEHAESLPIPAANPFGAPSRAEARPVFQAPAVYTLTSGDKFGEGLRSVLTVMTRDGGAEARIVVEPPALGRVDVSLRTSGGGVEANFKVDNEELRQMVQKQLDSLKESLNAQGIHVSGLTVDIKNSEGDRDRGNMGASKKGRRPGRREQADGDIPDGARVLRLDLEQGLLHWVA